MGSYESIHNDTDFPVVVWFQLLGGGPPNLGYDSEILHPNLKTEPKTFSLNLVHQVCVKFRDPQNPGRQRVMCKKCWSPARADNTSIVKVSDVVGKNTLPLYNDVQVAKAEEKVMEVEAEQEEAVAVAQQAEQQYEKQQEQKAELQAEKSAVIQEEQAMEQMEAEAQAQQQKQQQKKQQAAAQQQAGAQQKAAQQAQMQQEEAQLQQMENAAATQQQAQPQAQPMGPQAGAAAAQTSCLANCALQLQSSPNSHLEGYAPGLFVLAFFLFALIGLRKFRRFPKMLQGSQVVLMDA